MSKHPRQTGTPSSAGQAAMAHAVDLHRSGQLDAAASAYRDILARSPRDFDASHMLGVVALQQGQLETAQDLLTRALALRPRDAAAMGNLGIAYLRRGLLNEARQWFEKALKIAPNSPVALSNMGTERFESGRYDAALILARKACLLDPNAYDACNLLGACLLKTGDTQTAATVLEVATQLQPKEAEAWANLASVMRALGKNDLANQYAHKASVLKPNSPLGMSAQATAQYAQGHIAEAIETFRKLLLLAPPTADTRLAYADVLLEDGLNEEALEQLQRALALKENDPTLRLAGVMAHLKRIYRTEPERAASREAFGKSLDEMRQWYAGKPAVEAAFQAVGTNQPFLLACHPYNNRDLLGRYGELCAALMSTLPLPAATAKRPSPQGDGGAGERKLRLGVVCAHVKDQSDWNAMAQGWLRNLDRDKFETWLFQLETSATEEAAAAAALVTHCENRPKNLPNWIKAIREADLDVILYPRIGLHALTLKLACLRLAPVQAATWGHPETTGLPTLDLYISAAAMEPPAAAENYTERLVTLPNIGVYVEPSGLEPRAPNLRTLKLPDNEPLLLCSGLPHQYLPQHDNVWLQIAQQLGRKSLLRRSSGGRLVFFKSLGEERNHLLENRLRATFDTAGVPFDAHVSFIPRLDRADLFGLMRQSALLLDTLGWSNFDTALDAVECGLPILAFEGELMRGRLASGILRQLDLSGWVATTTDEFVQKAVKLTQDSRGRKELQARILERKEKLFSDLAPVRALESCLLEACARGHS